MVPAKPPGGSVFLVEDEVMIRMMVADMLEELGYSVAAEAGDIEEAAQLARTRIRHRHPRRQRQRKADFPGGRGDRGCATGPSYSQPAMARRACRPNFATVRRCRSHSRWKTSLHDRAHAQGSAAGLKRLTAAALAERSFTSRSPSGSRRTHRRCGPAAAASPRRMRRERREIGSLRRRIHRAARSNPIQKYGLPRPSRRSSIFRKPRLRLPCRVTSTPADLVRRTGREIDVDHGVRGHAGFDHLADNLAARSARGIPQRHVAGLHAEFLRQREGRKPEDSAFDRARDGAGIDDVLGDVAARD